MEANCHCHLHYPTSCVWTHPLALLLARRQVGNLTRDRNYWGMPERANIVRPVTSLTAARPGTDVVAMTAAALAAASVAIRDKSSQVRTHG